MAMVFNFKIFYAGEQIGVERLELDSIKVGRLSSANLRLEDPTVSRIHALIEAGPGGEVTVSDMGSSAGTFVNGEKIQRAALKAGDELVLGKSKLLIEWDREVAVLTAPVPDFPRKDEPKEFVPVSSEPPTGERRSLAAEPEPVVEAHEARDEPPEERAPVHRIDALSRGEPQSKPIGKLKLAAAAAAPARAAKPAKEKPGKEAARAAAPAAEQAEYDEPVTHDNRALEIKVLWHGAPVEVKYFVKPQQVTVGATKKCDFYLIPEGLPVSEYPIVRTLGGEYVLTFTEDMEGEVFIGDASKTFEELRQEGRASSDPALHKSYQYTLPKDSITNVTVDQCVLQMRFTPPPKRLPIGSLKRIDYNYLNALLFALFASMTLMVSLFLFPFDLKSETEDITKNPNKFVNFIMTPAKKQEDPYLEKLKKQPKEGESGAKAALKEGKMGKKDAPDVFKRSAVKAIKLDDKEIVAKSGLLKIFGKGGGIFQGSGQIFGGKGLGGDLQNALGGLFGTTIGDARGSGGLGLKGSGPGGGGDSLYSIGIGTVGTRGRGAGQGGYGYGVGSIGGKRDHDIGISGGTPVVLGSLDKELIRRVIHAHRNEVRYCYERALTANPGLWGKITVTFIIAANGTVQSSKVKETTMNNPDVENCIAQKIKLWKFPEPKGGGIVVVTYPFVLKQTD